MWLGTLRLWQYLVVNSDEKSDGVKVVAFEFLLNFLKMLAKIFYMCYTVYAKLIKYEVL